MGLRTDILQTNLHGVDLDPRAVEIAQLNLIIRAAKVATDFPPSRRLYGSATRLCPTLPVILERSIGPRHFRDQLGTAGLM